MASKYYIAHSLKGREWKNHKYIRKYLSKNGKVVYDYGNGAVKPDVPGESKYRNYVDQYNVKTNEWRTNRRSNTDSHGYGNTQYNYKRTDKNGRTVEGKVDITVSKGKSFFSKRKTIIVNGTDKYVSVERGKLRQSAEKGADWLAKKLKKKK